MRFVVELTERNYRWKITMIRIFLGRKFYDPDNSVRIEGAWVTFKETKYNIYSYMLDCMIRGREMKPFLRRVNSGSDVMIFSDEYLAFYRA